MNDQPTTESQDERWGFFFEVCAYLTFFITYALQDFHTKRAGNALANLKNVA